MDTILRYSVLKQHKPQLQTLALQVADTTTNRAQLVQTTRDFKLLDDQQKMAQIKPLLRAYQMEIDVVSKKLVVAQDAFLSIYKTVMALPDISPLMAEFSVLKSNSGITRIKQTLERCTG